MHYSSIVNVVPVGRFEMKTGAMSITPVFRND